MGATKECITHGPWGGTHGKEWVYMPHGFIRKISVRHGDVIDSIKFQTFNRIGESETQASFFGGPGGNRTDTICVDHPQEYLISITGTYGPYGADVVNSICFVTNENQYGPYGRESGTAFSYDGKGGVIVGFHGRVDKYLASIGIYVLPESLAFSRSSTDETKIMHELRSSMSRMVMSRDVAAWGCAGEVRRDGKLVLSPIRGGTGASKVEVVNLDGEDEYLTGISGRYSSSSIMSMSFHTNKQTYGPYGEKIGTWFTSVSNTSVGKVVGFHGWSSGYLNKLGVHMEYF